jgi:hypothetical protein
MPPLTKRQREAKAQRNKIRRQSRGPAGRRRDQDLRNAARLRASQRSQSSEQDIPMFHPDPAPNISSSSSSSSSSAANNSDHINDGNDDNRSIRQRNVPQRFLETPDTPPRIQNNRRNPRIIVDDDENELIDNFILEDRNNNLLNDPQIEIIRLLMNMNENPMNSYVAHNPWRNNALLAVNDLLNPPVNMIPPNS